jgi:hypothetical protein
MSRVRSGVGTGLPRRARPDLRPSRGARAAKRWMRPHQAAAGSGRRAARAANVEGGNPGLSVVTRMGHASGGISGGTGSRRSRPTGGGHRAWQSSSCGPPEGWRGCTGVCGRAGCPNVRLPVGLRQAPRGTASTARAMRQPRQPTNDAPTGPALPDAIGLVCADDSLLGVDGAAGPPGPCERPAYTGRVNSGLRRSGCMGTTSGRLAEIQDGEPAAATQGIDPS